MSSLTPRLDSLQGSVHNVMINGNMEFAQRGTSTATAPDSTFIVDRWKYNKSSLSAVVTVSQDSDAPTYEQSGVISSKSMKIEITTGVTSNTASLMEFLYTMEGNDYSQIFGKKIRLQFWTKTNCAGTYAVTLSSIGNSRHYATSFTVTAGEASGALWVKRTFDIQMDTQSGAHFGVNAALYVFINLTAGSTYQISTPNQWQDTGARGVIGQVDFAATTGNYFKVAQVMMCDATYLPPDADLPFKRAGKTIGDEFNLCQRYYQIVSISQYRPLGVFRGTGSTSQSNHIGLPVTMRATPTSVSKSLTMAYWATLGAAHTSSGASTLSIGGVNPSTISFNCPLVAVNNVSYIFANYSAATTMELTAEL